MKESTKSLIDNFNEKQMQRKSFKPNTLLYCTYVIALIFMRVFLLIFIHLWLGKKKKQKIEIYEIVPQQTKEIKLHAKLITLIVVFQEATQKKTI